MTFLPIVGRELIEASRRRGTYWIRVGLAAAGLVIMGWVMLFPELRAPARLGMTLFIPLVILVQIYCVLIGVFRTADCVSEEKREGTLGLLFLTDLKGHDIVLGKLAATSLNSIYGVLALFPVMAIPLLAGGVALVEFGRVVLVCVNNLFFSLAVGMFCSSINRDERRAMISSFSLVFLFTVGLPIIAGISEDRQWGASYRLYQWFLVPSPGFAAFMAFEDPFRNTQMGGLFLWSVGVIHLLGWALLIAASLVVPRTWQDRPLRDEGSRRQKLIETFEPGGLRRRRTQRQELLRINPIYWLVTREPGKMLVIWAALALGALAWTLGLIFHPRDWRSEEAYVLTALCAHALLKFWVVTEACRRFSLDRQSGALELLLSTPISVRDIVRGQVLGLERQFAVPVVVVLLADLAFLMAKQSETGWTVLWVTGMLVFLADLFTLSWVGMWRGLNSRRPNRAAAAAMVRVLVLPWILMGMVTTAIGLLDVFSVGRSHFLTENGLTLLYLTISLIVDAAFGWPARRRLLSEFRQVATQRFESRMTGTGS